MKEATGELSTTVITVVAIAAISALFITFLYPQLKASIILSQACSNGPGYHYDGDNYTVDCPGGNNRLGAGSTWTCTFTDENGRARTKTCNNA